MFVPLVPSLQASLVVGRGSLSPEWLWTWGGEDQGWESFLSRLPKRLVMSWVVMELLPKEMPIETGHCVGYGSARQEALPFWGSAGAIAETERGFGPLSEGHQKSRAHISVGTDANGIKFALKACASFDLAARWS